MDPPLRREERIKDATLKVTLASLLCLATVSYVDYATGYEFLTSKLNLRISHGISPEALAEIKRELSKGTSPES